MIFSLRHIATFLRTRKSERKESGRVLSKPCNNLLHRDYVIRYTRDGVADVIVGSKPEGS